MGIPPFANAPAPNAQTDARYSRYGSLRHSGETWVTTWPNNMTSLAVTPTTILGAASTLISFRVRHIAASNLSYIRLVYSNWTSTTGVGEIPNANVITVEASVALQGSTVDDETPKKMTVRFNGAASVQIPTGGYAISDPIPLSLTAGQPFYEYNAVTVPTNTDVLPRGFASYGGGGAWAANINFGEGYKATDLTIQGSQTATKATAFFYSAYGILGYSLNQTPGIVVIGDSIGDGANDCGSRIGSGGFIERYLTGQSNLIMDASMIPRYGYVKVTRGGETTASYADFSLSSRRRFIAEYADVAIVEYGRNDLGGVLSDIQANIISICNNLINQGIAVIKTTILPATDSTDGFKTAANQTPKSFESTRTALNDWIKSPTGLAAQISNSSLFGVWDVCRNIEVNSSNVITTNGGRWIANPQSIGTTVGSGILTAVGSSSVTDSALSIADNAAQACTIHFTSGTASNQCSEIQYNTGSSGLIKLNTSLSPNASIGDGYEILKTYTTTTEGTHPSSYGHKVIVDGLTTSERSMIDNLYIYAISNVL